MTPLQGFGLGQLGMILAIFFLSFEFSAEWRRRRKAEQQLQREVKTLRWDLDRLRDWFRASIKK